jgi:uncharacterized metal-binding protein
MKPRALDLFCCAGVQRAASSLLDSTSDAQAAMGIDWMPMRSLSQAIPPAYAQFIGEQALAHIKQAGDGPRRERSQSREENECLTT